MIVLLCPSINCAFSVSLRGRDERPSGEMQVGSIHTPGRVSNNGRFGSCLRSAITHRRTGEQTRSLEDGYATRRYATLRYSTPRYATLRHATPLSVPRSARRLPNNQVEPLCLANIACWMFWPLFSAAFSWTYHIISCHIYYSFSMYIHSTYILCFHRG